MVLSTIIFGAFVFWAVVQCAYGFYFVNDILLRPAHINKDIANAWQPVSIIICARNEAHNLEKNLPAILEQIYFSTHKELFFEVIVVNDASDDDTGMVLAQFKTIYPQLRVVDIPAGTAHTLKGKKFALSVGVAQAKNDWLLLTDADCCPASKLWLQKMVAPMTGGKEIVAGYGGYNPAPGILNTFIRWETIHAFIQCGAYARSGKPYMAVGRNMACSKSVFLKAQSSSVWNISPSGDDDLLVNTCGTPGNYAIVDNPAAFTYTEAPTKLVDWMQQKRRHLTDGKNYQPGIKRLLAVYGFTHAAIWFYFILLLFTQFRQPALGIMSFRCLLFWISWEAKATQLKEKSIVYFIPFFDFGWMLHNFVFLPYIVLKNKQHWK